MCIYIFDGVGTRSVNHQSRLGFDSSDYEYGVTARWLYKRTMTDDVAVCGGFHFFTVPSSQAEEGVLPCLV